MGSRHWSALGMRCSLPSIVFRADHRGTAHDLFAWLGVLSLFLLTVVQSGHDGTRDKNAEAVDDCP